MDRRKNIHELLNNIAAELLEYIKSEEQNFLDKWVPASDIKRSLDLNFVAVPKQNKQYGQKGWMFAILARMLEDNNQLEFRKVGPRSFYRSVFPR